MSVNVMFVCLGNICRSPTAHGLFAARVEQAGLSGHIQVRSGGTGGWHVGNPPDERSVRVALERGIDLSHLRASQVSSRDFQSCDYMLAMDAANLADLRRMAPPAYPGVLDLFLTFAADSGYREVPDPYYGGEDGFQLVVDLIEAASDGLLQHIRRHQLGQG